MAKRIDADLAVRLYIEDESRSAMWVANEMGVSHRSVTRALRLAGIELRPQTHQRKIDWDAVVKMYQENPGLSAQQVAKKMGISTAQATLILRRRGVLETRLGGRASTGVCSVCGTTELFEYGKCRPCLVQYKYWHKIKQKYGITREDWERIRDEQGGRCALCDRKPKELVVDHCHETGVVRGLVCRGCNVALGRLGDNLESIKRVIEYLERSRG